MTKRLFLGACWGLALCCICLAPNAAFASGFFHPEVGARSIARGGATVVGNEDLSAFYVNIANLAQVDGTNLFLENNYDFFHTYYRREPYQKASWNVNPFDPIQFAGISSDFGLDTWTFGFAVYGPYGVTSRWSRTGPARYNIIEANSLQVYYSLGAAWNPTEWLRIGAKASLVNFKLDNYYGYSILRDRNPAFDVVAQFVAWTDFVPSWGAGIVVAPVPGWVEVGFSYLPRFEVTVVGKIRAELPKLYAAILGYSVYEDDMRIPLHYPEMYKGGIRFMYHDIADLEFDVCYIPWTILQYYDIDLKKEEILADFKYPLGWKDTFNYRLGGSYRINNHWEVSAGYSYEQSANPPEMGGLEANRNMFSGGFKMSYFGMDFDFGYMHIFQDDVETPVPLVYDSPLDDGRGRYKTSYDVLIGSVNFNIERMYMAFHDGQRPW